MRVEIQTIGFDAWQPLKAYIEKKVGKIQHVWNAVTDVIIYLRNLNTNGKSRQVEIKALVPGNTLIVTERGQSFEEAFDLAMDSIVRQVRRYKEKHRYSA